MKRLSREEAKKVRAWWKANADSLGLPYKESGLVPNKVKAGYAAAKK